MRRSTPLAVAALLAVASTAVAGGSLSLRHGRYVDVGSECLGATSAGKSWFGGGYVFQAPHVQCEAVRVAHVAPDRYRVVTRCFENADRSLPFVVVNHIRLIGHTEYELKNRFGAFHARWCPG
ncbi:MAG TPA: hypothetical protein VN805_14960 [Caulobacteraceae bacterium]|nr:hypothetical protein [Caulobacteraceae bacterium]